jgi:GT2 family glycosyltransferase
MGAAVLMRRDLFFSCGRWDEDFTFGGEDIELSARVGQEHTLIYHPAAEIVHYGRVSTRLNLGYSSPNVAVGFARYLRKSGTSRSALFLYKLIYTLDAPLHMAVKVFEGVYRRLRGRRAAATKSFLVARGLGHFLTRGLKPFWKV